MNQKEKVILIEFANKVAELGITLNTEFGTKDYYYEIVTYVDEIQILDLDDNVLVSIDKNINNE